jgi:hypothetical protein
VVAALRWAKTPADPWAVGNVGEKGESARCPNPGSMAQREVDSNFSFISSISVRDHFLSLMILVSARY